MTLPSTIRLMVFVAAPLLASCSGEDTRSLPTGTSSVAVAAAAEPQKEVGGIAYYTCSMHPSVRSDGPGTCPICSMNLTPVTREEVESGVITIDEGRRQTIGVTVESVERRPFRITVRAVGQVTYDDTRLADVTLKLRGWIGELRANSPGQRVERGDVLFTLYSPELYAAQEELLSAVASQTKARGSAAPRRADYLVEAGRERLRLWDIQPSQIDGILGRGKPLEYMPIVSPVSGYVIEKNVVEGAAVEPGARLYRIAGLDQVWIEAEIYESDLPLVAVGDPVRVHLPYTPDRVQDGHVAFVYPYLDDSTRTGRARIELSNPDLALKPHMYANVELEKLLGDRLTVPEDAVLYAGRRNFVFVDLGEGRLRPQSIEIGRRAGEWIEIRKGLEEGDRVVTSGNFLVAAESRLKLDMEHWQ